MKDKKNLFFPVEVISWMGFILSFAIGVPLLCSPFYYAHIKLLHLEEATGLSFAQIKQAYDEMMHFCIFGGEFSTGVLKWSESGKAHFEDVGVLFRIDLIVLIVTSIILIATCIYRKKNGKSAFSSYRGYTSRYWGSILLGVLFMLIGLVGSIDFNTTFIIFHQIFFPGKTNWWFDPSKDEIINVLPQVFFRNCAILIVVILLGLCVWFVMAENRRLKGKGK